MNAVQEFISITPWTIIFQICNLLILLLLVADYALLVVAGRADDRADRMYRKWKMQSIDSNIDAENAKYTFGKGADDES